MKLFDPTMNLEKTDPLTATIFAKTADEIPHVTKVGSIIRLHRVQTVRFNRLPLINCDVTIKSAWVLFDPTKDSGPIEESGKEHSSTPEEKTILAKYRKFAKNYFANNKLKASTFKEGEKKYKDFDVVCFVMDVKKKGNSSKVTLCDAEKTVKLDVPNRKKLVMAPGEVIRIRSANYTNKEYNTIELNEYSNVLRLSENYKSAKELIKEIDHEDADNISELEEPVVGSKISAGYKQTRKALLSELFDKSGEKSGQKYFKVLVNVKEVRPKSPKEWIWVYDKKTKKQMTLDEAFKGKKNGKLPSDMKYFYKIQLYVHDKDSKDSSMYILMVSTLGDKCPDFISHDLGHEYPSRKDFAELKRIYKAITNPLVSLNMVVEVQEVARKQPVFFVIDTVLTI